MSDRVTAVLAAIGLLVILLVLAIMSPRANSNEFSYGEYYVPKDAVTTFDGASSIYREMCEGKVDNCPVTKLSMSKSPMLLEYHNEYEETNKYGTIYFFLSANTLNTDERVITEESYTTDKSSNPLQFKMDSIVKKGKTRITDLFLASVSDSMRSSYYELLAPFSFNFGDVNTECDKSITIISMNKKAKITFENVSNWFCAGEPNKDDSWLYHDNKHNTIIGNTSNANLKSGIAGSVVGYGNGETTVTFSIVDDSGKWIQCSLVDLFFYGDRDEPTYDIIPEI